MPEQNYTVQIIAYHKDKESKPAQGQFRSEWGRTVAVAGAWWCTLYGLEP